MKSDVIILIIVKLIHVIKITTFLRSIPGKNKLKHIVIYYDLETLQVPHNSSSNNPNQTYKEKTDIHIPCGYSIRLVRSYGVNITINYRGADCMKHFWHSLRDIVYMISEIKQKPMDLLTD